MVIYKIKFVNYFKLTSLLIIFFFYDEIKHTKRIRFVNIYIRILLERKWYCIGYFRGSLIEYHF